MRHYLLILFLAAVLCFPFKSTAQVKEGKYLNRAEKRVENGNHAGARRLLKKAKEADYGWCGNSYAEVFLRIAKAEARMLMIEDTPLEAFEELNSLRCRLVSCEEVDSLKLVALIAAYGYDTVLPEFKDALFNLPYSSLVTSHKSLTLDLSFLETPFSIDATRAVLIGGHRAIKIAEQGGKQLTDREKQMLIIQNLPIYSLLED